MAEKMHIFLIYTVYLLELSKFGKKCCISIFPHDEQKAAYYFILF